MPIIRGEFPCMCYCKVYKGLPHQAGAGKCTGTEWADSARQLHDQDQCADCPERMRQLQCSCSTGQESLSVCEVYRDVIDRGRYPDHVFPILDIESTYVIEECHR